MSAKNSRRSSSTTYAAIEPRSVSGAYSTTAAGLLVAAAAVIAIALAVRFGVWAGSSAAPAVPAAAATPSIVIVASPSASPVVGSGVTALDVGGVSMTAPTAWNRIGTDVLGPGSLLGFTNLDAHHACCKLDPGSFMLGVAEVQRPDFDISTYQPDGSTRSSVGAYVIVKSTMDPQPENFIEVHTLWLMGRPGLGNPFLEVSAIFRGPNSSSMESDVDAFVARLSLDPVAAPIPS